MSVESALITRIKKDIWKHKKEKRYFENGVLPPAAAAAGPDKIATNGCGPLMGCSSSSAAPNSRQANNNEKSPKGRGSKRKLKCLWAIAWVSIDMCLWECKWTGSRNSLHENACVCIYLVNPSNSQTRQENQECAVKEIKGMGKKYCCLAFATLFTFACSSCQFYLSFSSADLCCTPRGYLTPQKADSTKELNEDADS